MVWVCVLISIGWAIVMPLADFGRALSLPRLVGATFAQLSFAGFMVTTGLLLGALAPSRSAAGAWSAAVLIASYLLVLISGLASSVENLRYVSPYYYSDLTGILAQGVEVDHQAALWSATAVLGWLALRAFRGRELGAERWQFSAPVHGGPRVTVLAAQPAGERFTRWASGRSRRWWAGVVALLVLAGGGAGALGGTLSEDAATTRSIVAEGRIDAPNARVLAPASGTLRALTVSEGDDVVAGQDLGWLHNALDGSAVPLRAPIAGRVAELRPHPGEFVPAGSTVASIYELGALFAVLEVDEGDVDEIARGQRMEVAVTTLGVTTATVVESVTRVPLSGDTVRSRDDPKYEVTSAPLRADPRLTVGMLAEGRIDVRGNQR
jgi:hypothetical protein